MAETMAREVTAVPGATELLAAVRAANLPIALASNSSRLELSAKLDRRGFAGAFGGPVFSYKDVPRPKPHPNIYLAAAAAWGADPVDCVVIEDGATGVRAGAAAGCMVLGFAHVIDPEALLATGAHTVFTDLKQVPELLGLNAEVANLKR